MYCLQILDLGLKLGWVCCGLAWLFFLCIFKAMKNGVFNLSHASLSDATSLSLE
jgi:hypothetical protein